jgi:hypothetical protein
MYAMLPRVTPMMSARPSLLTSTVTRSRCCARGVALTARAGPRPAAFLPPTAKVCAVLFVRPVTVRARVVPPTAYVFPPGEPVTV